MAVATTTTSTLSAPFWSTALRTEFSSKVEYLKAINDEHYCSIVWLESLLLMLPIYEFHAVVTLPTL